MKKILKYLPIVIMLALLTFIITNDVWGKDFEDKPDKITNNTFITNTTDNSKLEDIAYCIKGEVQFIREENLTIGIYGKTNVRHPKIDNEVGINIVIGLGKSAGQKEREALERRIERLEKKLGYIGVDTVETKNEKGYIISIEKKDKMKVLRRF